MAEKALKEERMLNAAFYYRFAEFFCFDSIEEKGRLFNQFMKLFYQALEDDRIERHEVTYYGGYLKAIRIKKDNAKSVEGRIFTKEEYASNHCQVGNIELALNYIAGWINRKI